MGAGEAGCGGAVPPAVTPGVPAALGQAHGREVAAAGGVLALPRAVAAPQQAFACGTGTRLVSAGEHRASRQLGARWRGRHDGATAPHRQPLPSVQWGPLQPWQQARTVRFHTTGRVSGGLRGESRHQEWARGHAARGWVPPSAPRPGITPALCTPRSPQHLPVDVAEGGARAGLGVVVGLTAVPTIGLAHAAPVDPPARQTVVVEAGTGHRVLTPRRHLLLRRHLHRLLAPPPATAPHSPAAPAPTPAPIPPLQIWAGAGIPPPCPISGVSTGLWHRPRRRGLTRWLLLPWPPRAAGRPGPNRAPAAPRPCRTVPRPRCAALAALAEERQCYQRSSHMATSPGVSPVLGSPVGTPRHQGCLARAIPPGSKAS